MRMSEDGSPKSGLKKKKSKFSSRFRSSQKFENRENARE